MSSQSFLDAQSSPASLTLAAKLWERIGAYPEREGLALLGGLFVGLAEVFETPALEFLDGLAAMAAQMEEDTAYLACPPGLGFDQPPSREPTPLDVDAELAAIDAAIDAADVSAAHVLSALVCVADEMAAHGGCTTSALLQRLCARARQIQARPARPASS